MFCPSPLPCMYILSFICIPRSPLWCLPLWGPINWVLVLFIFLYKLSLYKYHVTNRFLKWLYSLKYTLEMLATSRLGNKHCCLYLISLVWGWEGCLWLNLFQVHLCWLRAFCIFACFSFVMKTISLNVPEKNMTLPRNIY